MLFTPTRWVTHTSHRQWLLGEADRLFSFYEPYAINPRGGFHDLDDRGEPLPTGWPPAAEPTRNLFTTTRLVHCFAIGTLLGRPGAARYVDHGMDFLWSGHRDRQSGGYRWSDGYAGPVDDSKQAYGHAFVLLAASSAKVAGHPDAERLLTDISTVLEERFWDPKYGMAAEEFTAEWQPKSDYRGQNSNMHLTEALMAAHEATGEQRYLDMAHSIARMLIRDIAASNEWRLPEHYHPDWSIDFDYGTDVFRPYGSTVGHWLEWVRLVLQLWEMGSRQETWMPEAARSLFTQATAEGWDHSQGGFYFTVDWEGRPVDRDRYWWPCTEGIGAAAFLGMIDGDQVYEDWYRRVWDWCEHHLIDRELGSWHHQLDDSLSPRTDPWFGKPDLYHTLQACLVPLLPTTGSIVRGLAETGVRL
ncbi:AGE family epimerase/isomerase [Phytoactinopolyspora halotolerans]|uniref:AGE family epimerase/isomerase n=1 Tax=Phytoactinopolyspora halotolerans TaxID=1981512 RepID=A0A6L9SHQ9_9ACTN|nr:AGE family epimerase/isomerase [Phytoactinopolyspora halotolerans]NEE04188.1 AGE family epimerase/isomerase [Phytoactinopolyspora halotolerans]